MTFRVFILTVMLISGCSTTSNIDTSLVSKFSGVWDETNNGACSSNFHTVEFNSSTLLIEYVEKGYISKNDGRKILKYSILSQTPTSIRVLLDNETRLDSNGQPVIWHLKSLNKGQYCWGRDDWREESCTPPRYRCKT